MFPFFLIGAIVAAAAVDFAPTWMFTARPATGFRLQIKNDTLTNLYHHLIPEQYFEQYIDHSNHDAGTWQQRYWVNVAYGTLQGPNFLILGGEAPISILDVAYDQYPHVQYAAQVKANLWVLEHRFYGKSFPASLETVNLDFLSSSQALEDIANFISYQNQVMALKNPKWILIGGSYSGSLALWSRERYPNLSSAAVLTSAPLQPVYDFHAYTQQFDSILDDYDPNCKDRIRDIFEELRDVILAHTNFYVVLDRAFKFVPSLMKLHLDIDEQSFYFVFERLIGYFHLAVQYHKVNVEPFASSTISIETLCAGISVSNFQAYFNIATLVNSEMEALGMNDTNIYVDYYQFVVYLQQTSNFSDPNQAAMRAWFWQSCNEFGYFPSTIGGHSGFSNLVPIKFYETLCSNVFGKDFPNFREAPAPTKYNFSNILSPRGSVDPWGTLVFTNSHDPTSITYLINDVGHCGDMAPASEKDSASLDQYRAVALRMIQEWLGISPKSDSLNFDIQNLLRNDSLY